MLRNADVFEKCIERQLCIYWWAGGWYKKQVALEGKGCCLSKHFPAPRALISLVHTDTGRMQIKENKMWNMSQNLVQLVYLDQKKPIRYPYSLPTLKRYRIIKQLTNQLQLEIILFISPKNSPSLSFVPFSHRPPLITPCHVDSPLTLPWEKDTFRKLFFLLGDQKLTGPIFRQHISVHHCAWHRQSCTWIIETTVNKTKRGIN